MLRLAFDFIITWRETRTRPNAYANLVGRKIINLPIQDVSEGNKNNLKNLMI